MVEYIYFHPILWLQNPVVIDVYLQWLGRFNDNFFKFRHVTFYVEKL